MLLKGFWQIGVRPASRAASCASGERPVKVQTVTSHGPTKYGPCRFSTECSALECWTCSSMEVVFVFLNHDVQSTIRYQPPFIKRIFVGMPQGNKQVIPLESGKGMLAVQRTVSRAASRAHFNRSARAASSPRVGTL
jgi:hypothetical protein